MKIEKIEQLLKKYFEGETSLEEEEQLRIFFRREKIPGHLQSYTDQFRYLEIVGEEQTEADPFAKISPFEVYTQKFQRRSGALMGMSNSIRWTLRIAAGTILALIGFSAGLLMNQQNGTSNRELSALKQEIQQMKTALMYGPYQQASASERISVVNMSTRLPASKQLDEEITEILTYTMNSDKNVNVRLAAAEALFRFRDETGVRKALTHSLTRQTDPLMQITLINMLVRIKEKGAINEMQKMLMNSETPEIVRQRLQEGIAELKT